MKCKFSKSQSYLKRVDQTLETLVGISDGDGDGRITKKELMILLSALIKFSLEIEMKNRGKIASLNENIFSFQ